MFAVGRLPGLGPGFHRRSSSVRGRRPLVALLLWLCACGVVAGACSGGGGGSGSPKTGAKVPVESTTTSSTVATTTTVAVDITKKPDVVTVAYADAVMDELDRLLSDAIRDFVAN